MFKNNITDWNNFIDFYLDLNKSINLTSISEKKEFFDKNILDSLSIEDFIDLNDKTLIDIGCGGGFPSLPLALKYKNLQVTALDSISKKLDAISKVSSHFDMNNIKFIAGRAEDLAHDIYREKYDIVTARAFANYKTMLELTSAYVKKGGILIAYQGPAIENELNQNKDYEKIFGLELKKIHKLKIANNSRFLLVFNKIENTEDRFPRKYNQIKNKSLS